VKRNDASSKLSMKASQSVKRKRATLRQKLSAFTTANVKKIKLFLGSATLLVAITLFLFFLRFLEFRFGWTWIGVGEVKLVNSVTSPAHEEVAFYQPAKTLWDLIVVLIFPVLAALVIWQLDKSDKDTKQKIADEERRQTQLTAFFDTLSDLARSNELQEPHKASIAREIIHARVLEVVKNLDGDRKAQVFEFLQGLQVLMPVQNNNGHSSRGWKDRNWDEENGEPAGLADSFNQPNITRYPDSILDGVDFSGIVLSNTKAAQMDLSGVRMNKARLDGVNFSDCIMQGVQFNDAYLHDVDFIEADLSGLQLANAKLEWLNFNRAKLHQSDWNGAMVTDAILNEAELFSADLTKTFFERVKLYRTGLQPGVKISQAQWVDVDLTEAELDEAVLNGSRFVRARFQRTRLVKANLENVDLRGCDMTGASFRGAVLNGAKLQGSTLKNCDFSRCQLRGTEIDDKTTFDDGENNKWFRIWQLVNGKAPFGLHITDLRDANLSNTQLRGRNFANCQMQGADLTGANLSDADLRNANLECPTGDPLDLEEKTILREADLTNCNLTGVRMMNVILDGANLSNAVLSGAILTGASCKGTKFHQAKIDENTQIDPKWLIVWRLVNGAWGGQSLTNKNLSDADLSKADLSGVDCSGANFDRANLSQTSFRGCQMEGASFKEAMLDGADFTGAFDISTRELEQAKTSRGLILPNGNKWNR
jgi:uncharacterized protein YjbI with pentapeptide repeats